MCSPLRPDNNSRLRSLLALIVSFLTPRKIPGFACLLYKSAHLRRSAVIILLSSALRNATANRDWRCVICQLKAVYIKVMSLQRGAIRRSLPFLCLFRETQTKRLLDRLLKCLSGINLIGVGKALLLTWDVSSCFSLDVQRLGRSLAQVIISVCLKCLKG